IYLSPQGKLWNDQLSREYAKSYDRLTMISGRYGGVDERFLELNNVEEISIGDYVLSGGELAVGVLIDSISRHIPGVLGHKESSTEESLARGTLEAPQYTRPVEMSGKKVPEILLSGNHQKIQAWREMMSLLVTRKKRPDLFKQLDLSEPRLMELDRFEKEMQP
ncbi:MAG: tRNA (guanosine(37)-N1)-methyltransferase TrmD, partial [Bdellovibrionales bacterium]|nr:tRNA (guanosine(37)-N1)-methyltransferase TrmD [Bdellovibrionales bacterium]